MSLKKERRNGQEYLRTVVDLPTFEEDDLYVLVECGTSEIWQLLNQDALDEWQPARQWYKDPHKCSALCENNSRGSALHLKSRLNPKSSRVSPSWRGATRPLYPSATPIAETRPLGYAFTGRFRSDVAFAQL